LVVEEVRHRFIVKPDMHPGTGLGDKLHIFDKQQVVWSRDPKSTNLRVTRIT
jgi:hypothetical protein